MRVKDKAMVSQVAKSCQSVDTLYIPLQTERQTRNFKVDK